jgi:hypothetical protein
MSATNLLFAAAAVAASVATFATHGGPVVDTAEAAELMRCGTLAVQGFAEKRGFAGTEKKVRVAAMGNWETRARSRLGIGYDSWSLSEGQEISCKRSFLTVRCVAVATPCTMVKVKRT